MALKLIRILSKGVWWSMDHLVKTPSPPAVNRWSPRYNIEKTTVNAEYIAGPFTTNYDYQSQTYAQQTTTTTFNQAGKKPKNILNKDGELPPDSKNAFAKNKHFGIDGK